MCETTSKDKYFWKRSGIISKGQLRNYLGEKGKKLCNKLRQQQTIFITMFVGDFFPLLQKFAKVIVSFLLIPDPLPQKRETNQ